MGKPVGVRRRSDYSDMPLATKLGLVNTEVQWAIEDGNAEEISKLKAEIAALEAAIEKTLVKKEGPPGGISMNPNHPFYADGPINKMPFGG
jgi:hypothetical protein